MKPLENKNDKTAHNDDKRSFIPFKRSKQAIICLLRIKRSAITLLSNALKKPDPKSPIRQVGYTCCYQHYTLTITSSFQAAYSIPFHDHGSNIYELNPELS